MAKKKIEKTNAIRLIEQKKIPYIEHTYEWSEAHVSANDVSLAVNTTSPIYKTLVATGNKTGPIVAVIPGDEEVDLKKLAKASGNKKVEMLHLKDLEATTGYIRGGCSPVGMKKLFPTFIAIQAQELAAFTISAGKRGLQMEVEPSAIASLIHATFVELTVTSET